MGLNLTGDLKNMIVEALDGMKSMTTTLESVGKSLAQVVELLKEIRDQDTKEPRV